MTNSNVKISNVFICNSFPFPDKTITRLSLRCSNLIEDIVAYPTRYDNKIIFLTSLVQHFLIPHTLSTRYLRHRRVVVSQQCHRIASFLRLVLSQISGTVFHCYLGNAVLGYIKRYNLQTVCFATEVFGGLSNDNDLNC